ncbi:MAG: hypothetical protein LLF95_06680 [Bacteroidales bacterium]|nr:hypothetical protein [Bacteroidales bacterium]
MVILLSFVLLFSNACKLQNYADKKSIDIRVSCMPDTVAYGDSLSVNVCYINISRNPIVFYPEAIISMMHVDTTSFIFWSEEHFLYPINGVCNFQNTVVLQPDQIHKTIYKIVVNNKFFFNDENNFILTYNLYMKNKKKPILPKPKEEQKILSMALSSSIFSLFVKDENR